MLKPPHPSDVAFALLVRWAVFNPRLAQWLCNAAFEEPKPKTLRELIERYVNAVGEEDEDIERMEHELVEACASPAALEEALELLHELIGDSGEVAHERAEVVMAEEKFGLIIRNVSRVAQAGNFEELCKLYEACLVFIHDPHEGGLLDEHSRLDTTTGSVLTNSRLMEMSHVMSSPARSAMMSALVSASSLEGKRPKKLKDEDFQKSANRLETRHTVEALHSFFDHASRRMSTQLPPTHPFSETLRVEGYPNRKSVFMQHAILELASVHHALGNDQQAFQAAREAVCVAQQNLDDTVLEASLNLYRRLDSSNTQLAEGNGTSRRRNPVSRLEYVREMLMGRIPRRPRLVWRELDDIHDVKFFSRQALLRSDAWEQFGNAALAETWSRTVAGDETASPEDQALAFCRLAFSRFVRGKEDPEDSSGLRFIQRAIDVLEANRTSSASGELPEDKLSSSTVAPIPQPKIVATIVATTLTMAHAHAVGKGDLGTAYRIRQLSSFSGCGSPQRMLQQELISHGNVADAFRTLSVGCSFESKQNRVFEADQLLQQSRLFKGERALEFALKAWALGQELNLRTLSAVACTQISRALLETGQTESALQKIRACLPQVAVHAPLMDLRECQLLEIKCLLQLGLSRKEDGTRDLEAVARRLKRFSDDMTRDDQGGELCLRSLLKESLYLLANVYNELGKVAERDAVADLFLQYDQGEVHPVDADKSAILGRERKPMMEAAVQVVNFGLLNINRTVE